MFKVQALDPLLDFLYQNILNLQELTHSSQDILMIKHSVQFSPVTHSCLTLCNPMVCGTPGFPVYHQLPEPAQTHVHRAGVASNHLILCHPLSSCPRSFPASGSFQMSQLSISGGQSVGVSPSTSVPPMNTQD